MKIFCIGLCRTGTESILSSLRTLGKKAIETPFGLWTRSVDKELDSLEFDAMGGDPMPLIFESLDNYYNDAKFILTVRETEYWIRSAQWQFGVGSVIDQDWQAYDYIESYHQALFGTSEFDFERFSYVYDRYNKRVSQYFSSRSEDLLTMDPADKNAWSALCEFLDCDSPDPSIPFPHENIRTYGNYYYPNSDNTEVPE